MAVWLVRAGSHGEYEPKFLQENRVYVTWEKLDVDLAGLPDRSALTDAMTRRYPESKPKTIATWVSQVWPFAHEMRNGDLVVLPLKTQRAVQIGEIASDYHFERGGPDPFFHWRAVKWIGESVPRANFGKDLLYTLGAAMTICRVQRNNAEARIAAMRATGWKPEQLVDAVRASAEATNAEVESEVDTDLEEAARDRIARAIVAKFKGHGLTRLVEAILRAQGYVT